MTHNGEPVGERKIRNKSDEILPIYITHSAILFVALYSRREHAFTVTRAETRSKSLKTGLTRTVQSDNRGDEIIREGISNKISDHLRWDRLIERRRHFRRLKQVDHDFYRVSTCRNLPFVQQRKHELL